MLQPKDCHNTYTFVLIALGSNVTSHIGTPAQTLQAMPGLLSDAGLKVERISRIFHTPAVPAGSGPDFANAVIGAKTDQSARDLLAGLHQVEQRFARDRKARWAPRTLDLDLLSYGTAIEPDRSVFERWAGLPPEKQQSQAPDQLILPHPRLHERAFVLLPLLDIAPDWVHPALGLSTRDMVDRLPPAALNGIVADDAL